MQPEAMSPCYPTSGYLLDVNSGNKASICWTYEVGTKVQRQGLLQSENQ